MSKLLEELHSHNLSVQHFSNLIGSHRNTVAKYIEDPSLVSEATRIKIESGIDILGRVNTVWPSWDNGNYSCKGQWYSILRERYLAEVREADREFNELYE